MNRVKFSQLNKNNAALKFCEVLQKSKFSGANFLILDFIFFNKWWVFC